MESRMQQLEKLRLAHDDCEDLKARLVNQRGWYHQMAVVGVSALLFVRANSLICTCSKSIYRGHRAASCTSCSRSLRTRRRPSSSGRCLPTLCQSGQRCRSPRCGRWLCRQCRTFWNTCLTTSTATTEQRGSSSGASSTPRIQSWWRSLLRTAAIRGIQASKISLMTTPTRSTQRRSGESCYRWALQSLLVSVFIFCSSSFSIEGSTKPNPQLFIRSKKLGNGAPRHKPVAKVINPRIDIGEFLKEQVQQQEKQRLQE
jgi:hypothetical protein